MVVGGVSGGLEWWAARGSWVQLEARGDKQKGNNKNQLYHPLGLAVGPLWKGDQELTGNGDTTCIRQKQVNLSSGRLRNENSKEI